MIEFIKWLFCCCSTNSRIPNETGPLLSTNQQPSDVVSQGINTGDTVITIDRETPAPRSQPGSRPHTPPDYSLLSTPPRRTAHQATTSTSDEPSSPYHLAGTPQRRTPTSASSTKSEGSTYSLANTPDSATSGSRGPSVPTSPDRDPTSPTRENTRRNFNTLFGDANPTSPSVQTGMSVHTPSSF